MKAELKVPSPNILRKRLGNVKARIKAAATADEPKKEKKKMSRNKPSTLERTVKPLTKERFRENLLIALDQMVLRRGGAGLAMHVESQILSCSASATSPGNLEFYPPARHSAKRARASSSGPS